MKLYEIARMPDPSDYRAGDERDPRSPYYNGPDDDQSDPLPEFLKKQPDVLDYKHDDDGAFAEWTVYCGTPEQAQAIVQYLQKAGLDRLKVNVVKDEPSNDPEETSYNVIATYQYATVPYEPDYEQMDRDRDY